MSGRRVRGSRYRVPPRKPMDQHKQTASFSLDPARRAWLRENYARLGYRNESHAVDELIKRLMDEGDSGRDRKRQ